jgi:hypothetical protein
MSAILPEGKLDPVDAILRMCERFGDEPQTFNRGMVERARVSYASCLQALQEAKEAFGKIFAEPYGCTLCDSGVPRNKEKGHQPDCPFEVARAALAHIEKVLNERKQE